MVGSLSQHYLFFYFYGNLYGILGFLKAFRLVFFLASRSLKFKWNPCSNSGRERGEKTDSCHPSMVYMIQD